MAFENNIEKTITDLKNQVKQYESLSDYDKLMNESYNDIIDEKESCAYTLNEYKNNFTNISNKSSESTFCDDDMFADIMKKINVIKQNMNNNNNITEMITMYDDLSNYKQLLVSYFNNKKMEIVNI